MEIICDTSFLIALVSNPVKCLDKVEYEIGKLRFIVPTFVLDELELIKKKSGPKKSMIANTAIQISKLKFEIKDIGIIWTGHAGFKITYESKKIYIDPYKLSKEHENVSDADIVLITHNHFDH